MTYATSQKPSPILIESPQSEAPQNFSLVLGGPLFQLLRKSHLEGDAAELLHRRIIGSVLITWLPLLLLTLVGKAGAAVPTSFFHDVEVQARFLVALPMLIVAEVIVHRRIMQVVCRFVDWRIVLPEHLQRFNKAVAAAVRLRNSLVVELGVLLFAYVVGLMVWTTRPVISSGTWFASPGARWNLTAAGFWYVFVSIPLFQFILLRWYLRIFIWFRFLWQVSRIDLNLIPTHPDRCAGLSFLGKSVYAFGPILFAQGAILAGVVADRVLYEGSSLQSLKFQIGGFVLFCVIAILAPLLMFTPRMAQTRRKGLADYGLFAQRYVESFDQKWVRRPLATDDLLGTGDIQSLADLANSFDVVREMRVVPFGLQDAIRLAVATAVPLTPLLLTIFSAEELLMRIIKVLF